MENLLLDEDLILKNTTEGKSLSELLRNGYTTHSVDYIKQGYDIFKQYPIGFIGYLFVICLLSFTLGKIPYVQIFISCLLAPFMMGAYFVSDKITKNESYSFGNFFDGVKKFKDIFLATLILSVVSGLIDLAVGGWYFFKIFFLGLDDGSMQDIGFIKENADRFSVAMIVYLLVGTFFIFSTFLIWFSDFSVVKSLDVSRKIIAKKYFNWIGFFFLLLLFNMAGAICFFIGLFVTIPTTMCAMYVAYKDVTGLVLID